MRENMHFPKYCIHITLKWLLKVRPMSRESSTEQTRTHARTMRHRERVRESLLPALETRRGQDSYELSTLSLSFYEFKLYKSVNWHFASPLHVGSYHSLTTMSWISIWSTPSLTLSSLSYNIFGWPSVACSNQWLFKAALHSYCPLWWSPSALIFTTLRFCRKTALPFSLYETLSPAEEDFSQYQWGLSFMFVTWLKSGILWVFDFFVFLFTLLRIFARSAPN